MTNWPLVPLREVLQLQRRWVTVNPTDDYTEIGVRSFGNGIFHKPPRLGQTLGDKRVLAVQPGDLVFNNVFAWEGAVALAGQTEAGTIGSHRFVTLTADASRCSTQFYRCFFTSEEGLAILRRVSPGSAGRNRTLNLAEFQKQLVPLPPLADQRRIVDRVDAVATRVAEVHRLQADADEEMNRLLTAIYQRITHEVPKRPMVEVAPLTRRPVKVDLTASYPQISARSFGKGTFHQPTLHGSDVTWEKPFQVKGGDILISNIKAWEGALAVVSAEDDGRFSSHRYLTCVPVPGVATARFVCFHLLTPEGLHHIGEASPGSADRNRTTSSKLLMQIPVPIPPFAEQIKFDALQAKLDAVRALQSETAGELDALLPSVLNKAFAGEL